MDLSKESAPSPEDATQDPEPEIHAGAMTVMLLRVRHSAKRKKDDVKCYRRARLRLLTIKTLQLLWLFKALHQDVRLIGKKKFCLLNQKGQNDGKIIFDAEQAKLLY